MKTLFETAKAPKIKFSSKPAPFEEDIIELPLEEFEKLVASRRNLPAFGYTESLLVPDWFELDNPDFSKFNSINPADKLVVCDMGEVGLGIYTKASIKKGEIVAVYAGNAVAEDSDDPYLMMNFNMENYPENLEEIMQKPLDEREDLINPIYSGKKEGGLASFMQSLPEKSRLNRQEIGHPIATANLRSHIEFFVAKDGRKIGLACLTALRDINPGEQLGFDYGADYFERFEIEELYFDKNNGNAYIPLMIDYPAALIEHLLQNIFNKNLPMVRDILCTLHPQVLHLLNNCPYNQSIIKEVLLSVKNLDVEIEDEIIKERCDKYKHLSAMYFMKFDFKTQSYASDEKMRLSNNRNSFKFSQSNAMNEEIENNIKEETAIYKSENLVPVRQFLSNIFP